jgi:WD40 repeat protein
VDSIALSPDASHVATGERNGSIRVWAHANAAEVSNPHREVLTAFELAANGAKLLTAGHEGEVTVWDTVTPAATEIRRFSVSRSRRPGPLHRGHEPPEVWAVVVALSPDGSRAAAVTIEGTVYVWDLATGAGCSSTLMAR